MRVSIRGRDDPHIDLHALPPAYRLDFAFLQGVQQFFLCGSRQFTNFAEKQCSAVGLNEFVAMLFSSACKSAFSYPNSIDSTKFSGRARQLTATKGFVRRAPLPWIARDQLFPDTGF